MSSSSRVRAAAPLAAAFAAIAVLAATACHSSQSTIQVEPAPLASVAPPEPAAVAAVELPGLHNVVTYAPDMIGGGQPEGVEGLETLARMGVKTIISVDGGKPDVETAQRLGLRYVHLPISYDTVSPQRQLELAQAVASCEGPVYMHCHHGKHRSGAGLASALVVCGVLTPEQAMERMAVSGTAKDYRGLWQAVAGARPADAASLRVDPSTFPSVAEVSGMVDTMAQLDLVFDLVKQAQNAGWQPPQGHPDLVAVNETRRLSTLFTNLEADPESRAMAGDYHAMLAKSLELSRTLDTAVRAGDAARADELLTAINKGCKECHLVYRDQ